MLIRPGVLEFVLSLAPPVTLILFLVALYRELTGHAGPSSRQDWALAAAAGTVIRIGFIVWSLVGTAAAVRSMPPQSRAQFSAAAIDLPGLWVHAIWRNILPDVIWIGFLLIFWRDVAPLGRWWTRGLAVVLCVVAMVPVVNGIGRTRASVDRYRADWRGRTVGLPVAQGQTQTRNAALTLAVRLIAPCGSSGAGAPMQLSGTANSYCLKEPTIVDQRDIAAAEFDQNAHDQSTIRLTLHDDAARRSIEVTGKNVGAPIAVVVNGQLVSVATIQVPLGKVWIARLAPNVADSMVEAFPRPHPVFPLWDQAALFWNLVILPTVLLAASAGLPCFLLSVCWTGPGAGTAAR